jgi:hypothetical protein
MTEKLEKKESKEATGAEQTTTNSGLRRSLLLGVPAVMGLFASACGTFSGYSKSGNGTPRKKTAPGKSPSTSGAAPGDDNAGGTAPGGMPGGEPVNAEPTTPEGPTPGGPTPVDSKCMLTRIEELSLKDAMVDAALLPNDAHYRVYGHKTRTSLVAIALKGVGAGSLVHLVKKTSGDNGAILASRRLSAMDINGSETHPIVFDNIKLGMLTSIEIVVIDGLKKRRVSMPIVYANKYKAAPVICPLAVSITDAEIAAQGGNLFGYYSGVYHGNYTDFSPTVDFGAGLAGGFPSATLSIGEQKTVARPFQVAKKDAMWSTNPVARSAAGAALTHEVMDVLGRPLAVDGSLLATRTNVFIIYVQDGTHWHRYFYFIG